MAGPRRGKRAKVTAKGARILIVEARFYDDIADALLAGAMKVLDEARPRSIASACPARSKSPPRSPWRSMRRRRKRRPYDGAVALGCVIRGDTIHFDIVSQQSARGLMDIAIARALPLGNGIITVDTEAQALARARPEERTRAATRRARRWRWSVSSAGWRGDDMTRAGARPQQGSRARRTSAARRGSPPCRRSTRWTLPAPA